jgi:hypothetical protein
MNGKLRAIRLRWCPKLRLGTVATFADRVTTAMRYGWDYPPVKVSPYLDGGDGDSHLRLYERPSSELRFSVVPMCYMSKF